MFHLEPSYLRYIYDGLEKGELHPDNAAALPEWLTGLYEAAFEESKPARERQKLLETFAVWALLKKEVSAQFVAEILEVPTQEIIDFIATYSSWFTSPESGKYQLYHERLKVYLLQKNSEREIDTLHEKLIVQLEQAIGERKADEFEFYALEFLSEHLYLSSQQDIQYKRLHEFVNSEITWRRQIEISIGYEWSQKAIQYGIKEAARRELEINTLRSSVNSLKLWQQEQNSTTEILRLLSLGSYEIALKRAENWDLERQFKLYLLMLHELTIGESREAIFQKDSCNAILYAIAQTPEDFSVLDWTKFYTE